MNAKGQLGEFLQTRRSQLRPEDLDVPTYQERRRVPGLRREELALLAGVSTSYYTRLEQGQSLNASPEVLDAIARALRLDEAERLHLHNLSRSAKGPGRARRPAPERVTRATGQVLEALADVPAIVVGRRSDVLAWNRLGHALFAGHLDPAVADRPGERPNMARLVFLDAHTRDLYADWPSKARAVVGSLRLVAGQYPDDAALHALVGELSAKSPDFASMWADHRIRPCAVADYRMRHPLVGPLTVTQQTWSQGPDQNIVIATTEADSPSRTALALLAGAITRTSSRSSSRTSSRNPATAVTPGVQDRAWGRADAA
ncbi:helix-turn-helix domain-containing protein [Streptacidiphilus sp. P02-A3a]|uniref:helix-turn-helix domain-containing protein n=1 Tax=Streptacidiphilus sp. P02-A3a TaxID=2704468 RepID=UPI0015FD1C98|nr:helix-turn-helix transcriptional regulator [Streptacidiphilus sp. P02-A3a]QMU73030.1 helix-turn-helix transcriptional regulator [Streptacidiphilus sp. P02-A3a]